MFFCVSFAVILAQYLYFVRKKLFRYKLIKMAFEVRKFCSIPARFRLFRHPDLPYFFSEESQILKCINLIKYFDPFWILVLIRYFQCYLTFSEPFKVDLIQLTFKVRKFRSVAARFRLFRHPDLPYFFSEQFSILKWLDCAILFEAYDSWWCLSMW